MLVCHTRPTGFSFQRYSVGYNLTTYRANALGTAKGSPNMRPHDLLEYSRIRASLNCFGVVRLEHSRWTIETVPVLDDTRQAQYKYHRMVSQALTRLINEKVLSQTV